MAIIDDLGAIIIIALFYTGQLSVGALALAAVGLAALFALNRFRVTAIAPYAIIGAFVWAAVLKSGVHATLAGVLAAFAIPLSANKPGGQSPLHKLEHDLHPWVAYFILPVFAFANAGVSLAGLSLASLLAPVTLGVAAGLFLGKQIGVLALSFVAVRMRLARLPHGVGWAHIYGAACLTGVGFTMSLFIGTLAFADAALLSQVKLGVLSGSVLSGVIGFVVLRSLRVGQASAVMIKDSHASVARI